MEWDREKCLKLIDSYEQYPVLWNPKHGLYYNKLKKHDAWVSIGEIMECSSEESKKKMDSILASFRREKSRGRKTVGTGKDIYVSRWFAFERLRFLLNKDEQKLWPKSSRDTKNVIIGIDYDAYENDSNDTLIEEGESTPNHDKQATILIKRELEEDSRIEKPFKILKETHATCAKESVQNSSTKDRFDIYGQHIAHKLRTYTIRAEAMVEHAINNILFQADMGHYDRIDHQEPPIVNMESIVNSFE